ncbi:MAG: ABC transporter substrate-binding protein [Gaiellaceae bacterium]
MKRRIEQGAKTIRPRMALVAVVGVAVALSLALGLSTSARATSAVTTGGTLNIEMPWGTIADNFNPMVPNGTNAGGTLSCLYEQLFFLNTVTSQITPVLGTKYTWSKDNLKLTITTRSGVTWSDGKPFSAADVAFTFNYIKQYPAIDLNGIWKGSNLTSVAATGTNQVVFTFSKPNTPMFVFIAGVYIIPEHIWSSNTSPNTDPNTNPVGTGPFVLKSFTPTAVIYDKNPSYWMAGRPYIDSVVIAAVKSNDTALLDLLAGNIDYTYDAITNPAQTYVAKNPSTNKFWWPDTNLNYLYFNTTKAPFNDPALRRALAYGLNTKLIAQRAYYGGVDASTGGQQAAVVGGQLTAWYPSSLKKLEWTYNVNTAKALLKQAGYTLKGGTLLTPKGKAIPKQQILIGGPGWTDYIVIATMVSQELKALGISSSVVQQPWGSYSTNLPKGNYQLAISWGNGPGPTPYFMDYNDFAKSKIGPTGTNWSFFSNPTINKALSTYAGSSDIKVQKTALATIMQQVLTNVPMVALTGRPNWFDYQTKTFTGWPDATNPYNAGDPPDSPGARLLYLNVHLP